MLKNVKNDLEAYVYEMRDKCGSYGSLEKYIDPQIKDSFLAKVNECEGWLYGEGENSTLKEYQDRLRSFSEVGDACKKRHWYYTEIQGVLSQLPAVEANIKQKAAEIEHLTDEQKETLTKKHEATLEFIGKVMEDIKTKQTWETPAYTLEQV